VCHALAASHRHGSYRVALLRHQRARDTACASWHLLASALTSGSLRNIACQQRRRIGISSN